VGPEAEAFSLPMAGKSSGSAWRMLTGRLEVVMMIELTMSLLRLRFESWDEAMKLRVSTLQFPVYVPTFCIRIP
jgi:hypothetical protein